MTRRACALVLPLLAWSAAGLAQTPPADLTLQEVAAGLSSPLAVRHAPDGRLFVVQKGGTVQRIVGATPVPFLTIAVNTSSESGLLGLAFHPDYDGVAERRFYVSYTSPDAGNPQAIAEFATSAGDPDVVDLASRREVIRIPDMAGNHNGGDIAFGPDGYLYWSSGDGGIQNDPNGFAQCLWKKPIDNDPSSCSPGGGTNYYLLGKILRIDPTQTTASASAEMCAATEGAQAGYRIPPDNPYVGSTDTCDEIAHVGMRNPWRMSFDRANGDLYISDVGQGSWEETTRIPAGELGHNLGWRCFEGVDAFNGTGPCATLDEDAVTFPFQVYGHDEGRCSISGGYRYRGPIAGLVGMYISADYCSREIFFARNDGVDWDPPVGSVDVWRTLDGGDGIATSIAGFGEDSDGNLYVAGFGNGRLYRFFSASSGTLFADGFE
ncbi:PQQ-dependent sugar dehydrogenase [Chiayiivirga flava]|uniref:Glucose/arabinose dehydrogenase n=1 Tax=Chiayiivirga flava TaxID=659595 RepID=A0A7W8D444_9GAMM|nr:PQQ-dependent sugar dehydrogenase [Chiayiivirga flava]MBB5207595.1 glucose/arabinose dehydrogenase [Chiayiivirga flava]